ncbi:MAG: hypothetical protein K8J31_16025, partial [Anaerolineae bacterium]|nr:hypothetical protein [Anaerolineae bacterium]
MLRPVTVYRIMTITFFITPVDPKAWEDPENPLEKPASDLYIEKTGFHEALLRQFPESKYNDEWHFWQLDKGDNKGIRIYLTSRNKEGWG